MSGFEKARQKLIAAFYTAIITCFVVFALLVMSSPASASEIKHRVTHDDVVNALESFLAENEAYFDIPYRIYSKRIMDVVTSDNKIEIRIVDRIRGKLLKSDHFQVIIMSNGKTIRRFELRGYIGIEVPVAIASRDLLRGESLENSNAYEISYRDLSGSAVRMPIYTSDEIADLVMRVNCQNGRTLDKTLMEKPDVVLRGDRVIVFFENDGLALTMIGKALESGKMGGRIKILNERSRKTIFCKVTGEGEVEAY